MLTLFPLPHQLGTLAWLWATLCLLTATTVSAQAQPVPVNSMAYATVDEKTFYVHGGFGGKLAVSQFFSLDLTQESWNVSSPPWRQLTYPSHLGDAPYDHSMTVSLDGRTLTIWSSLSNLIADYSIMDKKWTKWPLILDLEGFPLIAADPTTETVFILKPTYLSKYNAASGFSSEAIPPSVVNNQYISSFVRSEFRKSFILCTGTDNTPSTFHEYTPSNGQWKALSTTGSMPPMRYSRCMVPAYEGTKMILFGGGDDPPGKVYGDIHILDMLSMRWTKGKSAPIARKGMACTVAGDNFIVWAGTNAGAPDGSAAPGPPLIYDISSNQWVQKYVRRTSYKPSSAPSPSPTNGLTPSGDAGDAGEGGGEGGGDSKGVNVAAIGGGIAGAGVVMAAIAFLVVRRRRQSRGQHNNTKFSGFDPHHDQGWLHMEDTNTGSSGNMHPNWKRRRRIPNSLRFIKNDLQSTPNSPQSTAPSPLESFYFTPDSSPVVPPPSSNSFQSINRQTRVRSMDQELLVIQEQIGTHRNSPQLIRNDPQSTPNSPDSTAPLPLESFYFTPASSPMIPPPSSNSFQSTDRQTRVRSMDQELLVIREQIGTHRNSPQLIRNDPQSSPNSPQPTVSSPLGSFYSTLASSPVILPPSSNPFQSTDRQTRVRSMDQELLAIQEQFGAHRNNPQYDPMEDQTLSPFTVRGPQGGVAEPALESSTWELRHQIQSIQEELSRREVK